MLERVVAVWKGLDSIVQSCNQDDAGCAWVCDVCKAHVLLLSTLRTGPYHSALDASMHRGYFDYSLYDDCIYDEGFRRRLEDDDTAPRRGLGGLNDYACPGIAMDIWLNRTDVREALHIQPDNRFNSADNGALRFSRLFIYLFIFGSPVDMS